MLDIQAEYPLVCRMFSHRFRIARMRGGPALLLDYEDTFQDYLLCLHRTEVEGTGFDPSRARLVTYLSLVAETTIRHAVRALGQRGRNLTDLGVKDDVASEGELNVVPPWFPSTEEPVDHARIMDALGSLGERDQLVLRRHYLEGASCTELAAELGVTRQRAQQLSTRALGRLQVAVLGLSKGSVE